MNIFKKNNEKKTTQKLPMTGKVRKGFRAYCAVIAAATLVCGMSVTAFAAIQMFPKEIQQADIDAKMHVYTFFKAL